MSHGVYPGRTRQRPSVRIAIPLEVSVGSVRPKMTQATLPQWAALTTVCGVMRKPEQLQPLLGAALPYYEEMKAVKI